jgi:hypothetical protein
MRPSEICNNAVKVWADTHYSKDVVSVRFFPATQLFAGEFLIRYDDTSGVFVNAESVNGKEMMKLK